MKFLIKFYQHAISPFFAPRCKYYPSCSNYSLQALELYSFRGIFLIVKRLLKCNPFSDGGIDEVPGKPQRVVKC
ncbi:MAG: membrane protein insertion efficiency factor YidD [Candidatus Ancillula sp.]|jgi:putative membrane protein insertion efficiency factor|nr:membrane protein insertion efficiency factor YidD [Candidatus Ancillula sp.]